MCFQASSCEHETQWFLLCPVVVCPQVTLIHSQMALADTELLPCVRQEVKEILLRKGVQLLLSMCKPPPALPLPWPGEIWLRLGHCPQPEGGRPRPQALCVLRLGRRDLSALSSS